MKTITSLSVWLLLFLHLTSYGQDQAKFISLTIPKDLKENANAVVRRSNTVINIEDIDEVTVLEDRIITVFNKTGLDNVNALEYYSDTRKIREMQVVIYDMLGNEIEKIKEKDFRDASAVSGGTLYADNRIKYLEYVPRNYPVTFHYTAEILYKSTAFLPQWRPIESFYCSTESSSIAVVNPNNIPLKFKEMNFDGYDISKPESLKYEVSNLPAIKNEAYRPDYNTFLPYVKFALKKFNMEGVEGVNNDWSDFGKWMYTALIADTQDLPEQVKFEVEELTKDATTDIEKARIVYQYVQDRSRYISVQVGIGGWKPINASEVHKMAYGDCKGLSNYTQSLLNHVGVTSHYAAIYGGSDKRSMDKDFSMTEGNHVILYLPKLEDGNDYWLECTSKNAPFGFMSDFTDDRDALVITPDGGEIVHTTDYLTDENEQITKGEFQINMDGTVTGNVNIKSRGIQYSWRNDLQHLSNAELKSRYLNQWEHLNGLTIQNASTTNNKVTPEFNEDIELNIVSYGSKTGDLLLFQPVILNRNQSEPPVYDDRQFDIEVERGYIDHDLYEINLEDGLTVDALPAAVELKNKYGEYSLSFQYDETKNIIEVDRFVKVNEGVFDKSEYQDFRDFRVSMVKNDHSRGVLKIKK